MNNHNKTDQKHTFYDTLNYINKTKYKNAEENYSS